MRWLIAICAVTLATSFADPQAPKVPDPPWTFTTTRLWRPVAGGNAVFFMDRAKMKGKDFGTIHYKLAPFRRIEVQLPIDWVKTFNFPMYLNDQYGDCYYAAGCHMDNLYTANATTKSDFALSAIRSRYFALSGGDNGLTDSDMQGEMLTRYLADVQAAKIVSYANIEPTDAQAVQSAIQSYGCVAFTFAVAPAWINNSSQGSVWDANTYRPNNNGHAVVLGGVEKNGYYKLLTWGTYVWLTPAGLKVCDPGAWVAFSTRWFNQRGYAPNGLHIAELAQMWQSDTGKTIPPAVIGSFPPPGPTPPKPPDPPIPPSPVASGTITWTINGVTSSYELMPIGTREAIKKLQESVGPIAP